MSAARIITPPLSGRDRQHFARELKKGEQAYERATREARAAHEAADRQLAMAHRLDCEAWSALQFIGGPEDPSPSISDALHGAVPLLEVQCRHCNHGEMIDLAEVIWPRQRGVHTLRAVLYCRACEKEYGTKRRPFLLGLRAREEPGPNAPASAKRA